MCLQLVPSIYILGTYVHPIAADRHLETLSSIYMRDPTPGSP